MKLKKNKFVIFYVFNIFLLIIILLLAIPLSKYLNRINFSDTDFVTNQKVVNPNAKSPKIIDREMQINFLAEVDDNLKWDFTTLQKNIVVKVVFNTPSNSGVSNSMVSIPVGAFISFNLLGNINLNNSY